jgi:hypothetical protein
VRSIARDNYPVERMAENRGRDRTYVKRLRAVGRFGDAELLARLVRRIARIRIQTGFGAYLLADSDGFVYLLRAESGVSDAMVNRLPRMLVGCYTSVTVQELDEDLISFLGVVQSNV